MNRTIRAVMTVAILLATARGALACKYAVRDVAFVDLGANAYLLRLHLPAGADDEAIAAVAREALAGANVRYELVADPPAEAPGMTLVAPDGRTLELPIDTTDEAAMRASIEAVVDSPLRRSLRRWTLASHSVVLVIHGDDAAHSAEAEAVADGAIADITAGLDDLPKPIARGPQRYALDRAAQQAERVLLFALGVEVDRPGDGAQVAIVYGRMRRLGPIAPVPPTERADLAAQMVYVGQDCECELDRSWMTGPMIPHRWSAADEAEAARALGFDPGSPLVQSEIRQILARGPSTTGRRNDRIGLARPVDPLLGYEEVELPPSPEAQPTRSRSSSPSPETESSDDGASYNSPPYYEDPPWRTPPPDYPDPFTAFLWSLASSLVIASMVLGTIVITRGGRF